MNTVWEGILVGAVGGGMAGLTVPLAMHFGRKIVDALDRARVYKWMKKNTRDEDGHRFRSTRAVASWNNLTLERARYLCSLDNRIYLSTGAKDEELWSIHDHGERSVYESRGLTTF